MLLMKTKGHGWQSLKPFSRKRIIILIYFIIIIIIPLIIIIIIIILRNIIIILIAMICVKSYLSIFCSSHARKSTICSNCSGLPRCLASVRLEVKLYFSKMLPAFHKIFTCIFQNLYMYFFT